LRNHVRERDYIGFLWARATALGSLRKGSRKRPALLVDVALVGSSLVAAVGAVVFAASMLVEGDHRPKVYGLQYLAIFAQPHGAVKAVPAAPTPVPLPYPIPAAGPIDMTSSGSISPIAPSHGAIDPMPAGSIGAAAPTGAASFTLVSAHPDLVWLRQGTRIFAVRAGDEIPGVGRVKEIAQREGRWVLVGADGGALLTSGAAGESDASFARSPFMRPMIFGAED
jgi:hypothetical protein